MSPAIFTLRPGGGGHAGRAARRPRTSDCEHAYRILVDESTSDPSVQTAPEPVQFRIALRMDLPLFVAAIQPSKPSPSYDFEPRNSDYSSTTKGRRRASASPTPRCSSCSPGPAALSTTLHRPPPHLDEPWSCRGAIMQAQFAGTRMEDDSDEGTDQPRRRASARRCTTATLATSSHPSRLTAQHQASSRRTRPRLAATRAELAVLSVTFRGRSAPGIAYALREGRDLLLERGHGSLDQTSHFDPIPPARGSTSRTLAPLGYRPRSSLAH